MVEIPSAFLALDDLSRKFGLIWPGIVGRNYTAAVKNAIRRTYTKQEK